MGYLDEFQDIDFSRGAALLSAVGVEWDFLLIISTKFKAVKNHPYYKMLPTLLSRVKKNHGDR